MSSESLICERRISTKACLGQQIAAALLGVGIAVGMFAFFPPAAPIGLLPWGVAFIWSKLLRAGYCYRLFQDRLEIETGLVSRKIENIELFRVRDVGLQQGVLGRVLNIGDVLVHSTDTTASDLHVKAIDDPREFYQQLRELVTQSRAAGRTVIMEDAPRFQQ